MSWHSVEAALGRDAGSRLARGLGTAAVTCLPMGLLMIAVIRGWSPLISVDNDLIRKATGVTRAADGFRGVLLAWQEAFVPRHVYLLAVPAVVWVWRAGLRSRAVWGVLTMLMGSSLAALVKVAVARARPVYDDPVGSAAGFSFPSGHAFNAAMATGTVLVMGWPLLATRARGVRWSVVAVGTAFVLLTALDRVFLGVHFPSDVTAGVLFAAGLTAASYVAFRYRPPARRDRKAEAKHAPHP